MDDFLYTALPLRVRFEQGGRKHVGEEMDAIAHDDIETLIRKANVGERPTT